MGLDPSTKFAGTMQPIIGMASYRNLDCGVTGAVAKALPGELFGYDVINVAVAARYLKIYDKATAPTQADTPKMTIAIPASGTRTKSYIGGVFFSAGISVRATTGIADNDTGAPNANDVQLVLEYL